MKTGTSSGRRFIARQEALFGDSYERQSRVLPVVGEQKDIRYYQQFAKNILNGPETTGMGFWSISTHMSDARSDARTATRGTRTVM